MKRIQLVGGPRNGAVQTVAALVTAIWVQSPGHDWIANDGGRQVRVRSVVTHRYERVDSMVLASEWGMLSGWPYLHSGNCRCGG